MLFLFRSLFPSWRFFESLEEMPRLSLRTGPDEKGLGPWIPLSWPRGRKMSSLLLNPAGNLEMAGRSLVERLADDLAETDEFSTSRISQGVSYRLTLNLVKFRILESRTASPGSRFQFKLSVGEEDLLISRIHEVEPR